VLEGGDADVSDAQARPGMLFSQMEPPDGWDSDFNDWYDTEHIPARLAIPGFARATRYRAIDGEPEYLAVYELSDLGALQTPEYHELRHSPSQRTTRMLGNARGFTRFICELVHDSGPADEHQCLSAVAFNVPAAEAKAFDDWYDSEHVPMLLQAPDWLRVRRYRVQSGEGGPWTDIAVHELRSAAVMQSEERAAARRAPKRTAIAARPWFAQSGRWLYEVLRRHG
jgi:hypothetical protein